jgi:hypothetical protein
MYTIYSVDIKMGEDGCVGDISDDQIKEDLDEGLQYC